MNIPAWRRDVFFRKHFARKFYNDFDSGTRKFHPTRFMVDAITSLGVTPHPLCSSLPFPSSPEFLWRASLLSAASIWTWSRLLIAFQRRAKL
jgi:hypothetical protein